MTSSSDSLQHTLHSIAAHLRQDASVIAQGDVVGRDRLEVQLTGLEELRNTIESSNQMNSSSQRLTQLLNSYVKVPMLKMLKETHTVVVVETCRTISVMLQCNDGCSDAWRTIALWFVSPLIVLTARANKAITAAAADTLTAIAKGPAFSPEVFGEVLKGCRARHPQARVHALQMLRDTMGHVKGTSAQFSLAQFITPITSVIRVAVVDSDAPVRQLGRACYWALYAVEQEAAEKFARTGLSQSVRALLEEERGAHFLLKEGSSAPREEKRVPSAVQHGDDKSASLHADIQAVTARRARDASRHARSVTPVNALQSPSRRPAQGATRMGQPTSGASPLMDEAAWHVMVSLISSPEWATRLDGVTELSTRLSENTIPITGSAAEEIIAILVPCMNDANHKVCSAALSCMKYLLIRCDGLHAIENHRHDIFMALLINAKSAKKIIAEDAMEILTQLLDSLDADTGLQVLTQCSSATSNPKVRQCNIEVLTYLFQKRFDFFLQPSPTRAALVVLVQQLRAEKETSALWRSTVSALTMLHRCASVCFISQLLLLPNEDQELLYAVLYNELPELRSDCSAYAARPSSMGRSPKTAEGKEEPQHATNLQLSIKPKDHQKMSTRQVTNASPSKAAAEGGYSPATRRDIKTAQKKQPTPVVVIASRSGFDGTGNSNAHFADPYRTYMGGQELMRGRPRLTSDGQAHGKGRAKAVDVIVEELLSQADDTTELTHTLDTMICALEANADIHLSDSCWNRLFHKFDKLSVEDHQPHHSVRRRSFAVMRLLVESPHARPVVGRQLTRLLRLCQCGLDDAFYEVQQESNLLLSTLLASLHLPLDLCLNGVAACLEGWLRGPCCNDGTRGSLELLASIARLLEYCASKSTRRKSTLSETLLHRIVGVLRECSDHCSAEVRRVATQGLAVFCAVLGKNAQSYMTTLSESRRKLVSVYSSN